MHKTTVFIFNYKHSIFFKTTTSIPCLVSNLIVDSLIDGEITFCTHPVNNATLATAFFLFIAGYISNVGKVFFGNLVGINLIIDLIFLGKTKKKGFDSFANIPIILK